MAVKTAYKIVPYDLSKGQLIERGKARPQGMIPYRLIDIRYEGNTLVSRPKLTPFATGVYGAAADITDGSTDGTLDTDAVVTNICSDGARVFGQTTIDIGQSNMTSPGLGSSDYVVELKNVNGAKTWCLTDIPAPRAATPVASTGPFSGASFNSGTGSDLLLSNYNYLTRTDSPDFFVLNSGTAINDPAALKKSSVLARFTGLALTRACGAGYTVSYDSVGARYICLKHDGLGIKSWVLLTTAGAATVASATGFDAMMIGDDLYLIVHQAGLTIRMYRYDMTSGGSPIAGSATSTPTNLSAASESSLAIGSANVRALAISSQTSPTEFRFAYVYDTGVAGNSTVYYVRRNLTTLVAVASYASGLTGSPTGNILNITCNGNIVLAEWKEGGGLSTINEFSAGSTLAMCYANRTACKVYAYVYDGGTALVEKALFPEATPAYLVASSGEEEEALQTYLYSHISSNGYVVIGDCVYQVLEVPATSPGVQKVKARFIAKALDYASSGAMYGDTATTPTPTVPRAMRESNSLSRWVSERYVALPLGSQERAAYVYDDGIAVGNGPAVNGMTSNERCVVFDIESPHMTATEIRAGVTALGHGFVISTNGETAPWCSVSRPLVKSISASYAADTTTNPWVAGEVISYRALAVASVNGIESYISSPVATYTVVAGDVNKSFTASVYLNGQCPTISKIRIYRSRSQLTENDEFHFLTEVDPPTEATNSVSFTDNRMDLSARPFDPTGGGLTLQGTFVSGLRDATSVAGRVYVATHSQAIPCQVQLGDDVLPCPMVDYAVQIPSTGGKVKHISALQDAIVVSSEVAIYGLSGDPPGEAGGNEIVAFTLSEGTGCNGKPVATPAGLMVPRETGISLVDRSRNVQEVASSISGDVNTDQMEFSGRCAYSVENDEAYFGRASGQGWMVLSVASARWTEWGTDVLTSPDMATCNRGPMSGMVAFTGGAADSADPAAPQIVLGWDSFPNRFTESKVRRILIDGYKFAEEEVGISVAASYNLNLTADTAVQYTVPAYSSGGRDTQGFRAQMSPARRSGSSFRFDITLTPTTNNKLSIETIAVEVLEETKRYVAGTVTGAPEV